MRIAYLGGPDLWLRIPMIKLLKEDGYDISCLGSNMEERVLFEKIGVQFHYYPLKRGIGGISELKGLIKLYFVLRAEHYDAVHAFDTIPTILGRLVAKAAGVPVIMGTIPGMGSIFSEDSYLNKTLRQIYKVGQKMACGVSDMTVFQNQDDLEFFIKKRMAVPYKTTLIRGSGVDVVKFSPGNLDNAVVDQTRSELGIRPGAVNVFMITRLVRYKGVIDFMKAARATKLRLPNVDFYLVGACDDTLAAVTLREVNEYSDCVKYVGARKDMPEVLYCADIVALPTYYREGVPRVLLEASCMEKPLIATSIAGCKDVVENAVTGFIVPPKAPDALATAIETLALDGDLRREMGIRAREKVMREFSLDVVFAATSSLYRRLNDASSQNSLVKKRIDSSDGRV